MAARIGIELSGGTCRIVELDPAPRWRYGRTDHRVIAFASLALTDPELAERLAALRGRRASVVIWTPHSTHRHVEVADGPYDRMRAEALAAAGGTGSTQAPALSDIAPAMLREPGLERRVAIVALVPGTEAADALRPLRDAGVTIDTVLTPASALTSLARLDRDHHAEGGFEGYIVLDESASAIAIVRNRQLVAVRTLPWGFLTESPVPEVRARDEIVQRLASELSMCMASGQQDVTLLTQVYLCGGLPELRSMAVSLTEWLDVEVETLDGLFGIDTTNLPEPAGEFRDRAAEFRIAWAAAVDRRPTFDLLRERKRRERKATWSMAAVVAGLTAGLAGAWVAQQRWRPVERMAERTSPGAAPASFTSSVPGRMDSASPPPPRVPTLPPGALRSTPPQLATRPPMSAPPALSQAIAPPTRRSVEPTRSRPVERPAPTRAPDPLPVASSAQRGASAPMPAVVDPAPLPFEATLGTILYGPERKLAIVDGRIVQAGDEVRGARIIEITPTTVYLRDQQGRLRRLTAEGSAR